MSLKYAIGIDIGGTKISVSAGNAKGKIFHNLIIPTRTGTQTRQSLAELITALEQLIGRYGKSGALGIGIGIPGPVDSKKGIVPLSPHLHGWENLPLRNIFQKKLKLPVSMSNDANAAALGEKCFGQGRGVANFIYMTVSTGIGSGVVINGKLFEGASFVAGEVGHMTIVPKGERCKCGKQGCLEAYASGTAIAHFAKQQFKKGPLAEGKAQNVGLAARAGNRMAVKVYERAGFYLGIGLANLLNILNPEKIILGGGVFKSAPPHFWKAMMASCRREAWPQAMKAVQIVPSKLKGHVADLGALALVFESCL